MGTNTVLAPRQPRPRLRALTAALGVSLLLLTGCSAASTPDGTTTEVAPAGPASGPAGGRAGAPVAPAPAQDAGGPVSVPYTTGSGRQIARTTSLTLVVEDVRGTADRIRGVAQALDGWVAQESLQLELGGGTDGIKPSGSWLTLSVPASRLDAATDQVAALGTVRHRGASAQDLTDTVVDLDARIRSLEASVARLQELVGRAGSVADIAAVERELANRQSELESLTAQRLRLAGAVERATLTVSLLTPAQSTTTNPIQTGWARGWAAFLESVAVLVTVVGAVLPYVLVLALVGLPLAWWWRRRRSARAGRHGRERGAGQDQGARQEARRQDATEDVPQEAVGDEDQGHRGEDGDQVGQ